MKRVILLTFGFMSWAWYEMSGGAEFQPGSNGVVVLAQVEQEILPEPEPRIQVTRADAGASLTSVADAKLDATLVSASAPIQPVRQIVQDERVASLVDKTLRNDAAPRTPAVVIEAVSVDYRFVSGSRVNLRSGPGTSFGVVARLSRGDEVEVLTDEGSGWVKLRALDGSDIGWMSEDFLEFASN